jgi:hypothetical protein
MQVKFDRESIEAAKVRSLLNVDLYTSRAIVRVTKAKTLDSLVELSRHNGSAFTDANIY